MSQSQSKAKSNKAASQPGAGLPVIIGAAVLLILFISWIAYRNFGPPPPPPPLPKTSNEVRMEKIYQSSAGDLNKLSDEDRQWLHEYSHGREKDAFNYYKSLQRK